MLRYIKTNKSISLIIRGETFTVPSTAANFQQVVEAVKDYNEKGEDSEYTLDSIRRLARIDTGFEEVSGKRFTFKGDRVIFDGMEVHTGLTERIARMRNMGEDVKSLLLFMDRVMRNPSTASQMELFDFLAANDLPITDRGTILAYKVVNQNYRDVHSNTFDNSVGAVVEMDRSEVDSNRHHTCSTGLHFCSRSYVSYFHGGDDHLMVVEIDPADVVSIPIDYGNSKGRCCRYKVVDELEETKSQRIASDYVHGDSYVVNDDDEEREEGFSHQGFVESQLSHLQKAHNKKGDQQGYLLTVVPEETPVSELLEDLKDSEPAIANVLNHPSLRVRKKVKRDTTGKERQLVLVCERNGAFVEPLEIRTWAISKDAS